MYHTITYNSATKDYITRAVETEAQAIGFLNFPPREFVSAIGYYHTDPRTGVVTINPNPNHLQFPCTPAEHIRRTQLIAGLMTETRVIFVDDTEVLDPTFWDDPAIKAATDAFNTRIATQTTTNQNETN